MIRTAIAVFVLVVMTGFCGSLVILASLLGMRDRAGGPYDLAVWWWARSVVWASRVRVVVHHGERANAAGGVFVVNHVSLFDVLAFASVVRRAKFVAKAELGNIPLFSRAMRSAGMVFIERDNRKAAFDSYKDVAGRVSEGSSVVVFAEGTRGKTYAIRPLKKGPFVMAINTQAPVIPTLIHGTMKVLPPGPLHLHPGEVHVHFLEPIPTAGLDQESRNGVAATAHARMAAELESVYGVGSERWEPRSKVLNA